MIERREVVIPERRETQELENPYREFIVDHAETTANTLIAGSDGYDYTTHAAYFYRQSVEGLLRTETFTEYDSVEKWDTLHLQVGMHASRQKDKELFHQCFASLIDPAAKWCLYASDAIEGHELANDAVLLELAQSCAAAEADGDFGTVASARSLLLQVDVHRGSQGEEEMLSQQAEVALYAAKAQEQGEAARYMSVWSELPVAKALGAKPPEAESGIDHRERYDLREQYAKQIGVSSLHTALTSNLGENLETALYMARADRAPVQTTELDLWAMPPDTAVRNIRQQLQINRGKPWSMDRITSALELVEAAEHHNDPQLRQSTKSALLEAWRVVCVTTGLEDRQRQKMFQEVQRYIPDIGPMDIIEAEALRYEDPTTLPSPRWPGTLRIVMN